MERPAPDALKRLDEELRMDSKECFETEGNAMKRITNLQPAEKVGPKVSACQGFGKKSAHRTSDKR